LRGYGFTKLNNHSRRYVLLLIYTESILTYFLFRYSFFSSVLCFMGDMMWGRQAKSTSCRTWKRGLIVSQIMPNHPIFHDFFQGINCLSDQFNLTSPSSKNISCRYSRKRWEKYWILASFFRNSTRSSYHL